MEDWLASAEARRTSDIRLFRARRNVNRGTPCSSAASDLQSCRRSFWRAGHSGILSHDTVRFLKAGKGTISVWRAKLRCISVGELAGGMIVETKV